MDAEADLAAAIVEPFLIPLRPFERIYWLYLCASLLIALAVYAGTRRGGTVRGAMRFCLPSAVYGHRSAWTDYKYLIVNGISYALLFAPLLVGSPAVSGWTARALQQVFGTAGLFVVPGIGTNVLLTFVVVLAFDAGVFFAHYLQHKVPVLWEFHKVHHSAEVLTPITVYRNHPVDDLLTGTFIALFSGAVYGAFGFVFSYGAREIEIGELNFILLVFYLTGANLRHSHVWLAYPKGLSRVLISPAQHQIHHSNDPRHFDKNLGFMFAHWDRLAGSLWVPEARERLRFGLEGGEHREYGSVWRLYFLPIAKIAARGHGVMRRVRGGRFFFSILSENPVTGGGGRDLLPHPPPTAPADGRDRPPGRPAGE